jgi:parallel beta-helix repeat protein
MNATCSLNYGYGILVESSEPMRLLEDIEIRNSYIDSNNNGMMIGNTIGSKVIGTVVQHNTNGIYLTGSLEFEVKESEFNHNTYGIFMSDSEEVLVERTRFESNENAIYLDSTNSSTIMYSLFTNGTWHAITIDTWLDLGPDSSNNLVYGNEFRDNGPRGTQVMDNGVDNHWYFDGEGNAWHDHWGPDLDNDTIVDEPYMIDGLANASDPYPRALDKGEMIIEDPEDPVDEDRKMPGENFWIIFGAAGILLVILLLSIIFIKRDE